MSIPITLDEVMALEKLMQIGLLDYKEAKTLVNNVLLPPTESPEA